MNSTFVSRDEVVRNAENKRISDPYFTKYEYVTLLACRTQELAEGATPLVQITDFNTNDPKFLWKVAEREILERKLPVIIRRDFPGAVHVEYWSVAELELAW